MAEWTSLIAGAVTVGGIRSPTIQIGNANAEAAAVVFAISNPLRQHRLDLEPARRILGYEPQDTWPQGLPFAVDGRSPD